MDENKKNFILIGNSAFAFTEDNTFISDIDICQGGSGNRKQNFNTITITALNGEPVDPQVYQTYGLLPNLTLYLNENKRNGQQWDGPTGNVENYPFFNSENPVDFPFLSSDPPPGVHAGFVDDPEFIDVNSLVGREYQHCFVPGFNGNPMPMMKHEEVGELKDGDSSEDDVVFVKEYKKGEEAEDKKVLPQLRRNPKRQVQIQKAANGLLSQYSFEELDACQGVKKKTTASGNNKRSTKTTGAVLSPPSPLSSLEIKEWPVDGMHEKPAFNPVTRKIVKHPNAAARKKPGPKPGASRQRPKRKTARRKAPSGDDVAKLTHDSLHHVLSYVQDVKDFNRLTGEHGGENLRQAKDLLLDSCALYCLSNGVSEAALGKYLDSLGEKEDVSGFLKGFVEDIDSGKKLPACKEE